MPFMLVTTRSAAATASVVALIVGRRVRGGHGPAGVTGSARVARGARFIARRSARLVAGRSARGGLHLARAQHRFLHRAAALGRTRSNRRAIRLLNRYGALLRHTPGGGAAAAGRGDRAGRRNRHGFRRRNGIRGIAAFVKAGIERIVIFRVEMILHDTQAFTEMTNLNERP